MKCISEWLNEALTETPPVISKLKCGFALVGFIDASRIVLHYWKSHQLIITEGHFMKFGLIL